MANTANTPKNNNEDDWNPDDLKAGGQWETIEGEVVPAKAQRKATNSIMGSLFGPLWNDSRARPLFLISMFMLLGVCALACFVLSLLLVGGGGGIGNGISLFDNPSAPTAQAAQPISDTVNLQVNGTPIAPGVPTRLTIGNKVFNVVGLRLNEKGEWPEYDKTDAKAAYWAGGTLVNYVIGLPANDDNKALFNTIQPNDLISFDTGVGTLRYRVGEITTVKADDATNVTAQNGARATIVLIGDEGDTRRVVVAPYIDEGTANQTAANGVPVNLGDVRVVALNQRIIPGNSVGLPGGKNYYQVNMQVTSLITRILDAGQFFSTLSDSSGGVYALSPQGSAAAGALGWAQGALQPSGTITVTAGFEVPETMPGPALTWQFAIDQKTPYVAKVAIPYKPLPVQPTATVPGVRAAEVNILNANVSPEGNEVRVVGTVRNLTDKQLTISAVTDFQLSTESGALSPLNSTLPPLPWVIGPGETLAFQVNFARPPLGTPEAYFTLFGETFGFGLPQN